MSVPAGAEIAIRTNEGIDSRDASEARSYAAQVDRDVVDINGNIVIPRGSDARLVVRNIGGNQVALDLQSVNVNGRRYTIDTDEAEVVGGGRRPGENRRTGEFVGGGAALGALIGAYRRGRERRWNWRSRRGRWPAQTAEGPLTKGDRVKGSRGIGAELPIGIAGLSASHRLNACDCPHQVAHPPASRLQRMTTASKRNPLLRRSNQWL